MREQLVDRPVRAGEADEAGPPGPAAAAIPTAELIALNFTTLRAFHCAKLGSEQAGYRLLLRGLDEARQICSGGEAWMRELERLWRRALNEYRRRYASQLPETV